MTFQEYHLVCPCCGAFSKFYSMMSCTIPYGSPDSEKEFTCTDLYRAGSNFSHETGSKGMNIPITRCYACHRYFQLKIARRLPSYDSPKKSETLPDIKAAFSAEEIHEAIESHAFQGAQEEQELRSLAWVVSNHVQRESVTSRMVNLDRSYSVSENIPADFEDRFRAFRSLITYWVNVAHRCSLDHTQRQRSMAENEHVMLITTSPDFENKIAEQMQAQQKAREHLWEKQVTEPVAELTWKKSNLERLIELLSDSPLNWKELSSKEYISSDQHKAIKTQLMKAEALRQLGRFDDSLQLTGNATDLKGMYRGHRHVARIIQELASREYTFLWLSIGEEDYSPAELAEQVRNKIRENQEAQREQQLRETAYERDRETLKRILLYQTEVDKRGVLEGKTTQQRIEGKLICPKCQFRYLWDGSRCGHCDNSVFEMGRPDDRAISKMKHQLSGR